MSGGVALVRFTQSLSSAASLEELERAFLAGFGQLFGAQVYGLALFDLSSGAVVWSTRANASDADVASLEVPLTISATLSGTLHFGSTEREYSADDLALAEALGAVIASAVERLQVQRLLEREREHALAAIELTGAPVVVTDPSGATRLNDAARELLAEVVNGGARLSELLALPSFPCRIEVELATGERATIHGHASPPLHDGGLVAVLELEPERPGRAPGPLAALTPREQEVAVLVVDGLADREIAERLCLSHHTVTQYVKRIYRKIEVDSRVGLTRLLLTARPSRSATIPPNTPR
jgi:DNA-binding NarL/FixJ family response regulator